MTTHTTDAREAAAKAYYESLNLYFKWENLEPEAAALQRTKIDAAIDAFLSKSLEEADEKTKAIAENLALMDEQFADQVCRCWNGTCYECSTRYLLALVTAFSAKLKEQKAAHAKIVRDEAILWPINGDAAATLRRLADKIVGD